MYRRLQILVATLALVSMSLAKIIQVHVDKDRYGPSAFKADVGDEIELHFKHGNATFTESTFEKPCVPRKGGIDSGFFRVPVSHRGKKSLTFSFFINSTDPIYFFNKQTHPRNACKAGFVGSINASSRQPASHFRTNAANFELDNPGDATQQQTILVTMTRTYTSPPSASVSQTSGSETDGANSSSKDGTKIVVGVVGIVLGVITLAATAFVLVAVRRRRNRRELLPYRYDRDFERQDRLASWRTRPVQLFVDVKGWFANVFASSRWRWHRLEEGEDRRISPFLPESGPVPEIREKSARYSGHAREARHISGSDATLVPDGPSSTSLSRAAVSDSEKDVTDGYWGQIDIDSYPFVLATGEDRAGDERSASRS